MNFNEEIFVKIIEIMFHERERIFAMKFKMTTEMKEKKFLISIAGNLDTSTYPMAETKIDDVLAKNAGNVEEIILDFKNLLYISSLGLRILFKLLKQFPSCVKIINVPDDVMDIFRMTGIDKTAIVEN